jgi:AcrR family transcriptional regulator
MTPDTGLRERKKLATRRALGAAAIRLAIEGGLENVLVEDIAAAANVSPRTFNNYFASKYEAICALMVDRSYQVGQELRARPAAEDLREAIGHAVLSVYGEASFAPDPGHIAALRLVTSSPVLRGEYLKALGVAQYELAVAIADRAGDGPAAGPFAARALAGAVTSALQAASERWLFAEPPVPLVPVVEAALREMAEGMAAVFGQEQQEQQEQQGEMAAHRAARTPAGPAVNRAPCPPRTG